MVGKRHMSQDDSLMQAATEREKSLMDENSTDRNDGARGIVNGKCSKMKQDKKHQLRLTLSTPLEDTEIESEDDILGILEHTPDALEGNVSFTGPRSIPYSRIFDLEKFSEVMPQVYIKRQGITLSIVCIDHQPGPLSFLNQHIVTIAIHHGSCHWTITRKAKQIASLHSQLRYFKAKLHMPAASTETRVRRQSMRSQIKKRADDDPRSHKKTSAKRIVKYPRREIHRMDGTSKDAVETYMSNLLHHPLLKGHQSVLEFFEISSISFVMSLGQKLKEGFVKKRTQSGRFFNCGMACLRQFQRRWLVLRETCLFFLTPLTGEIRNVMLMDSGFQVSHGFRHTGVRKGIKVTNSTRGLVIRCDGEESEKAWAYAIEKAKNNYGDEFIRRNRFSSFAPIRRNSDARWYVDGACYMSDVADILEQAQEEIYITDWWLSPDIYMKRPDLTGIQWRLSEVLRRQASRGVKIFILLYKEVKLALGLDSLYSKHCLGRLNNNIKVLRHPDHLKKSGSLYWAHHEKMVVIDQQYAFVGGIDLCYGRWDDCRHKLVDVGHGGMKQKRNSNPSNTLGLAQLVQSTHNLFNPLAIPINEEGLSGSRSSITKAGHSRSSHKRSRKKGLPNITLTRAESSDSSESDADPITENTDIPSEVSNSHKDLAVSFNKSYSSSSDDDSRNAKAGVSRSASRNNWNLKTMKSLGKDIVEEVKKTRAKSLVDKAIVKLHRSNSIDSEDGLATKSDDEQIHKKKAKTRKLQNKWKRGLKRYRHAKSAADALSSKTNSLFDLHKDVYSAEAPSVHLWVGKDYVNWITKDLYDAQSPFKDNINRHSTPRMPWHDIALYVEGEAARDAARHFIQRWNVVKTEKVKHKNHYPYLVPRTYDSSFFSKSNLSPKHNVKCQVLRSIGPWSAGLLGREKERSIYLAYLDAIKKSRHYIYIENQFFITSCSDMRSEVFNTIGYQLAERIILADRNNETFRVYIVLPLLPAFEGLIGTPNGIPMQYIMYYTYESIIRGPNSLIGRLTEENVCWQKYLTFCSLRNHEVLNGDLVSELIYVHSKLMIVDDRLVIAGSANINDRSMLGDRDSEVDLIIEDNEFSPGLMDGKQYDRGDFAGTLRMYLFSEHLGLDSKSGIDIRDPVSEDFFKLWQRIASKNTKIYDDVFSTIPCDAVSTFPEMHQLLAKIPLALRAPDKAKEMVEKIQGHLVLYPLMFLKNEPLKPGVGNKEFLLPFDLWT